MATIISTKTSGVGGLEVTGDATGVLQLASNNGTTAVTVDASQNVGIGTNSPTWKVSVKQSGNTGSASLGLSIQNSADDSWMGMGYDATSGAMRIISTYVTTGSFKPLSFWTSDTERMRIDSSGNVLVGKAGTGFSTNGIELRADNELWVTRDSSIPVSLNRKTSTGELTRFHYNGTKVGDISTNGTGTTYNSSSDYRLKENIAPMTGALDKVAQLKPVTYTWKADGSNGQGFIAHELQAVVPDCVTGEKDAVNEDGSINPQGIDTSKLVATLTAAIQEQQAIINDLKARIETLEGASA